MKSLLPSSVEARKLREVSFALLLRDRQPLEIAALASALGFDQAVTATAVADLAAVGWLDLDSQGCVIGAAGLSLSHGPHRLQLAEQSFQTWCAYDSLGIAAALSSDAVLETACGQCGVLIKLAFAAGQPERNGPELLWLATGGSDLRSSFCTPTVLLCGPEHGAAWAQNQADRGQLLDLHSAAQSGAADWASCAQAARRLA